MLRYRIFTPDDFPALEALDLAVQRRADPAFDTLDEREREGRLRTSLPALKFFERSEHSFLAEEEGQLMGVLLAQAVWQGDKPVVMVVQVLLAEGAPGEAASGLLHACVKSAYDAAVYEVHFPVTPELESAAHNEEAHLLGRYAVSYLGSRHQTASGERLSKMPNTGGESKA
ncbi:DUF1999 domain-containing protein [Deinococcus psychrotolerans]|uniref:DUF1999 domain-containing protein n=1 Tax=Deinococcus psychrotolerans TaxID=2489213 RepID=A0A3G8YJG5_9DEIO|nr:DUF1999 domain-containing protein [Deinococcus psychrotolerans]AZI42704.1 DUF1999 domain-containing protein [Deinococcus psychrotolerans]